jgi:hypothetical protein
MKKAVVRMKKLNRPDEKGRRPDEKGRRPDEKTQSSG